jgi:histone deacetylase 11
MHHSAPLTASINPRVIFSPAYDIHLFGLERLHPFDGRKFSKSWRAARLILGERLESRTLKPDRQISVDELLTVHTATYLEKLKSPPYLAKILEFPILRTLPAFFLEGRLLKPMRLATYGTVTAARQALSDALVINLGGGYHHASRDKGEGFCCFADVSLAITIMRQTGELKPGLDRVMIIDLDAHQGNGHERTSIGDNDIYIFDMYNRAIYPQDYVARKRINCDVGLPAGTDETVYLQQLKKRLSEALIEADHPKLAFYIAGTDIYEHDQLGGLNVSAEGIMARDRFVLNALMAAGIPTVVLTGGGYSQQSYQFIANMLEHVFVTWPPTAA